MAERAVASSDKPTVRHPRPDELPTVAKVGWRGFRSGKLEFWTSYFQDNPHAQGDAVLVAELDGVLVGCAAALTMTISLAGADVPMRGVAAVSVVPEARRRGVADALMKEHLRRMRKRGDALSMLYPFQQRFYRKFGYETVEWSDHLRAAPALFPGSPRRRHARPFDVDRDGAEVRALYDRTRAGTTGRLTRNDWWWRIRVWKRAPDGVVWVDPKDGKIRGALHYDLPDKPPYPRQMIHVKDFVAETPEAFRGLIGFLEALGEQIDVVQLVLPPGEGATLLLDRPPAPDDTFGVLEPAGYVTPGAMGRIVDVGGAFALHPGPARSGIRGRIGLDVIDPLFAPQNRPLDLVVDGKGARVEPGAKAKDRLRLGVEKLAQVYFGAAPATRLLKQGLAQGSPRAAELLDEWLAGPPCFLGLGNFF